MKLYGAVTEASDANIAALIAATTGKLDTARYEADRNADAPLRVLAWGRSTSGGVLIAGYNVVSSTRESTGGYAFTLSLDVDVSLCAALGGPTPTSGYTGYGHATAPAGNVVRVQTFDGNGVSNRENSFILYGPAE